jgi:glycosyltransferase involved in cell wall biosynthesis
MLISVITITYNAQQTLQRTLDSVSRQQYRQLEHWIIDGASTDGTVAMAERYQAQADYEVHIVSEPDKGIYDAMNKGLELAMGDYLVFLNAGDALHDGDTLATVARHISDHTTDGTTPAVVYGETAITDEEGHFLHMRRHKAPEHLSWRSFRQGMLVCHQAFYVRSDLALLTPYDLQYRHSADVDWCIRIMKEAEQQGLPLVNTHAVLADFAEGGDTSRNHRASLKERYRVMNSHYGYVRTFLMHCWFVIRSLGV